MLAASVPASFPIPFANSAGAGYIRAIPTSSQIGVTPGAASLTDGFPLLNFLPVVSGGVPPFGQDMNGILNEVTANIQWTQAGGAPVYNSAFSTAIGGYPNGSVLQSADGTGYWRSIADNNTVNPDTVTAYVSGTTNWLPHFFYGDATIALTNANLTLTAVQYAKPTLVLTGTLTGNLNLVFPAIIGEWLIQNSTTGAFTITAKTASGTGVALSSGATGLWGDATNIYAALTPASIPKQIQPISASVASNALTVNLAATSLDFRSATLGTGAPIAGVSIPALSIVVPTSATLGTVNAVQAQIAVLVAYNAGSPVLCVVNMAGGVNLDETTLISPTTISSGATSASVIYSASAVAANSPFRVVGYLTSTEAAAGTWATAPSLVQGQGGQAMAAMQSLGFGQTWQNVTGSRAVATNYYNTTGKPIWVLVCNVNSSSTGSAYVNGVQIATFNTSATGTNATVSFIVPVGASYQVQIASTYTWAEMR